MRRTLILAGALLAFGLAPRLALADTGHGTGDEAKALVEKAVALIKQEGPQKAFAAFDDKANKDFHYKDLYIFVRTFDGNTVAHGANMALIGHTSLQTKDADGKLYVKEMVEDAKTKGSGWVDYRWPNPVDKKIEQKSSYIERVGDYIVCAGFYK
ncbi:MAG TPA: cache domain-containing protein [Stellaceae bacterium]|nr:cache domain-containing protein [Stellaceae bacterium]